ncbi:MAG: hypothetical protein ACETWG_06290 [Candidatus Neomarinimicrobiota bacterium]
MKVKFTGVIQSLIGLLLILPAISQGQLASKRWNVFDVNRIATTFGNYGAIAEGQLWYGAGHHPAFEYPIGSGAEYGMAVGFYVGGYSEDGGGENPDGKWYFDMSLDEYKDNWDDYHWDPYGPGPYPNDVPLTGIYDFVGQAQRAAMSDDPDSWPDPINADGRYGWPAEYPHTGEAVLLDATGWPGFGPNGECIGHQESFSVAYSVNHIAEIPPERWLKTQVVFRGVAFKGKLYEDYIFWAHYITNIGTKPITDCYFGMWGDYNFVWNQDWSNPECEAFDARRQMGYAWNPTGYHETPAGFPVEPTAYAGIIFLKTPKSNEGDEMGVTTVSWAVDPGGDDSGNIMDDFYSRNILNEGSPYDTDGDGIDDTHERDGVEYDYGYTPEWSDAGMFFMNSGPVTLAPGETDTLIVCTVIGDNLLDLRKNADRAITLYNSGWKIAEPPPEAIVQAVAGDRSVTLTWGQESESASDFEGYRIYRSKDGGATWGDRVVTDPTGTVVGYVPLAQFDKVDGIVGPSSHPDATWLDFGDDSGMPDTTAAGLYTFTDTDVINGLTYRYYVAAYNTGELAPPPVENSPNSAPSIANDNTVEVTPMAAVATQSLDSVKVVPNPYLAANEWETKLFVRELHFTHLPAKCTIRIYNSAAELVQTLEHTNGTSVEAWNLRSSADQEVAPGLYFYHIESENPKAEKVDKFLIIK